MQKILEVHRTSKTKIEDVQKHLDNGWKLIHMSHTDYIRLYALEKVDNAVTPLDRDVIKKFMKEKYSTFRNGHIEYVLNEFFEWHNTQSVVETAKENPNCKNVPHVKCNQLEGGCAYPDCGHENF